MVFLEVYPNKRAAKNPLECLHKKIVAIISQKSAQSPFLRPIFNISRFDYHAPISIFVVHKIHSLKIN